MNKIKLLIVSTFLIANLAHADTWVSLGGGTDHFCHTCGYNGFNPGLGIQNDDYLDLKDTKLIAGGYYNSFYRVSMYAGVNYQPLQYGFVKAGIIGGVVTNYTNLKIPVMVLPVISIEGQNVGLDILGAPSVGGYTGLVTVNLKFKL